MKNLLSIVFFALFLFSRETAVEKPAKTLKVEQFSGYVQKGPFVNGSSILISELDSNLNQTGRIYSSTVADNSGSFEQKQLELVSNYVQFGKKQGRISGAANQNDFCSGKKTSSE